MSKFHEGQLVLLPSLNRGGPLVGVYMKAFYAGDGSTETVHMAYHVNDTFKRTHLYRDGELIACKEGFSVLDDYVYHNNDEGIVQPVCCVFAGEDMAGSDSRRRRAMMMAELLVKTSQEWRREFFGIKSKAEIEAEDGPDGA